jgi:hypothetical protein
LQRIHAQLRRTFEPLFVKGSMKKLHLMPGFFKAADKLGNPDRNGVILRGIAIYHQDTHHRLSLLHPYLKSIIF